MINSANPEGGDSNEPLTAGLLQAYGGPKALIIDQVTSPEKCPGEVLVSVKAAAANGIDWKIREGYMRERFKLALPATLGIEMAGVVIQPGPGITSAIERNRTGHPPGIIVADLTR